MFVAEENGLTPLPVLPACPFFPSPRSLTLTHHLEPTESPATLSLLPVALTSHFKANPFACRSYLITPGMAVSPVSVIPSRARTSTSLHSLREKNPSFSSPLPTTHSPLPTIPFRNNTYKTDTKQTTLSTFRMNTYAKPRGEGLLSLTKNLLTISDLARLESQWIGWHLLRHSRATWLSESGAAMRAAQDILGQSGLIWKRRFGSTRTPGRARNDGLQQT